MTAPGRGGSELPTRARVLEFIETAEGTVGRREIARTFGVRGAERAALTRLLRDMADEGLIERPGRAKPGSLPPVFVATIVALDDGGEPVAVPADWRGDDPPPRFAVAPPRHRRGVAPGVDDRVLVRHAGRSRAEIIRVIGRRPRRVVGVYDRARDGNGGFVRSVERRERTGLRIAEGANGDALPGDLVVAETSPGAPLARVTAAFGALDRPGAIARLVLERHDIPYEFSPAALAEAAAATPPALGDRTDLRALPLVTIDDEDARDFDDAVWAEPANGGWHLVVAIADVAHYVRHGGALDREARRRGNSVYLPDRAIPMLPEALSNGLCSLRPGEDRACVAVHLWIDAGGAPVRHRFERALMRSAARLTYRDAQERGPSDPALAALFGAFGALKRARAARGSLDFDLPERRVLFDGAGEVSAIEPRPRFDSHRLIEEFMIAANVAAAETLVACETPCLFRVHDQPPLDKLETLRNCLAGLGYKLAPGRRLAPAQLDGLLARSRGRPEQEAVAMAVLRAQAQAEYSPRNIGHFGLNLRRYGHFTSPIRRYADLLVHRALIRALHLGGNGSSGESTGSLVEIGAALSDVERRATAAEREAVDRLAARFLAERVGATFDARVVGVTRFGLFVGLADTGAEGLVPMRSFAERMRYDEARSRLVGERSGAAIGLGALVRATLVEADAVTGTLRFALASPVGRWPRAPSGD